MRAIFSRVKLKEKQIWLLAVLVLFGSGCRNDSALTACPNDQQRGSRFFTQHCFEPFRCHGGCYTAGMYRQFFVCENRLPYFHRLFRNASRTGF